MTSHRRDAESRIRLRHLLRRGFANGIFKKKEDYGRGALLVNVSDLYSPNAVVDDSKLERVEVTTDELATFGVHEGDIFFVRSSLKLDGIAVAARAGAAQEPRVFECHVVGVRPDTGRIDPRFLTYQLNAEPVRSSTVSRATTTTMTTISQDHLADIRVWCPPLELQRRIADYLDAEVSRIDALTGGKQRVLDLLAEKRKAIIATAVTRGLDPKVKLRDSGVPWLGEIPAHWSLVPLRYLVSFLSGGTPDKGNAGFWIGGNIPWVSPKDMKVESIDDSEDHITKEAVDRSATRLVPVGSVLIVVRGMILAHTLPVAVTTGPVTINQDIKALVCGDRLQPEFLRIVLVGLSHLLLSLADSSAHGTKKMETEVLQRLEVPVPLLDEQRTIVDHIARETTKLDAVRAATERTIALLKERRSALIAAAVTGQLDVGGAA